MENQRATVLVIEDTEPVQKLIFFCLSKQFNVRTAATLKSAREILTDLEPDLILLDVMLPDGDGFSFCEELQKSGLTDRVPVVFLTARGTTGERVQGLKLGAEDYIVKPFEPDELLARVETRLRSFERKGTGADEGVYGDLKFKLSVQKLYHVTDSGDVEIDVTPLEFKLLFLLASHEGEVMTREALIKEAWGNQIHILDRTIDSHLSKVRKKLSVSAYTVRSVHKAGYRFVSRQSQSEGADAA